MNRRPAASRGFTLVELMVSIAIGMMIVIALMTMLANVSRNQSEMNVSNRSIEGGRFSMQVLVSDLSQAGFWGGFVPQFDDLTATAAPGDIPTGVPDPCLAFGSWAGTPNHLNNIIGIPVQAWRIPYTSGAVEAPVYCSSVISNLYGTSAVQNDVLFVRHLEPCLVGTGTDDCADTRTASSPHAYMQISRCSRDASSYVLATTGFTLHDGSTTDCPASPAALGAGVAATRRFSSSIYYVRNYATTAGDGVPTLVRSKFGVSDTSTSGNAPAFQANQALVEGVEAFRVEYGLDTLSKGGTNLMTSATAPNRFMDAVNWASTTSLTNPQNRGNGLPDIYVSCTQASSAVTCTNTSTGATVDPQYLVHAVAVKIYVLVRGEKPSKGYTDVKKYCLASTCSTSSDYVGPFNDEYRRHVFTQTVRLSNVSGRREVPT